jgi:hypothetical protein
LPYSDACYCREEDVRLPREGYCLGEDEAGELDETRKLKIVNTWATRKLECKYTTKERATIHITVTQMLYILSS